MNMILRVFCLCLFWSMFLCGLSLAGADERERDFLKALDIFDNSKTPEDFHAAAKAFESLLEDGYDNGAVNYNLGNAYFRANEFGKAIVHFRRAKRYLPRDPFVQANLQQAIAAAPGKMLVNHAPWTERFLFWSGWLSVLEKCVAMTVLFGAACLLVVCGCVFKNSKLTWLALPAAILSLAVGGDLALGSPELLGVRHAAITRETVARKGAAESYESAFDKPLLDGAEFTILSETNNWTFGNFEGVGTGWVRNEFVAK